MKPSLISFLAIALLSTAIVSAQDPTAPHDEIQKLRTEAQRVEAEIALLTARLQQLKEQLAKIEAHQPATDRLPLPSLLFPIGVERAMLGDAVHRQSIVPQPDNGIFDDKKPGPGRFGPAFPRRK